MIEGLVVCWLCVVVMVVVPDLLIGGGVAVLLLGAWGYARTGRGLTVRADPAASRGSNSARSVALLCCVVATAAIADALWIHRAFADPPPVLVGVLLYAALPTTAVALVAHRAGASGGRWAALYLALMALGGSAWLVYWLASCGQNCM